MLIWGQKHTKVKKNYKFCRISVFVKVPHCLDILYHGVNRMHGFDIKYLYENNTHLRRFKSMYNFKN